MGQGRPGLNHIIRHMRHHNLLPADEDNDERSETKGSSTYRTLGAESSRESLGGTTKGLRDSWCVSTIAKREDIYIATLN